MYKFCVDLREVEITKLIFCLAKARVDLDYDDNRCFFEYLVGDLIKFTDPTLEEQYNKKLKKYNKLIKSGINETYAKALKHLNDDMQVLMNTLSLREMFNLNLQEYKNCNSSMLDISHNVFLAFDEESVRGEYLGLEEICNKRSYNNKCINDKIKEINEIIDNYYNQLETENADNK